MTDELERRSGLCTAGGPGTKSLVEDHGRHTVKLRTAVCYNWSCSVKNSLSIWYRHSTMYHDIENFHLWKRKWTLVRCPLYVCFRMPACSRQGAFARMFYHPAYALAYQYVMLDNRRLQRSSVFCLNDVRATDECICGLGSVAFQRCMDYVGDRRVVKRILNYLTFYSQCLSRSAR